MSPNYTDSSEMDDMNALNVPSHQPKQEQAAEERPHHSTKNKTQEPNTTLTNTKSPQPHEIPGHGWTNGAAPYLMYPQTREGRIELYRSHRRWIHPSTTAWSRTGAGDPNDAVAKATPTSTTSTSPLDPEEERKTAGALLSQLSEKFHSLGWKPGTGGGMSLRTGDGTATRPYHVFSTPSGVQKEDMIGDDVFVLDMEERVVLPPVTPGLKLSSMTCLWFVVYRLRPSAMCVVHTHSLNAKLATLLDGDNHDAKDGIGVLKLTHLEMLKGVGNHAYDDVLEVPIIENQRSEDLLAPDLERAIRKYPKCNAVLVRRHGVYVWGDSWEQAKVQLESFDYLFETAVRMRSMGLDCGVVPSKVQDLPTNQKNHKNKRKEREQDGEKEEREEQRPTKYMRSNSTDSVSTSSSSACHDVSDSDQSIVGTNTNTKLIQTIPLLPLHSQTLLLDVEGCFCHTNNITETILNPHLETYVNSISSNDELQHLQSKLSSELHQLEPHHPSRAWWDGFRTTQFHSSSPQTEVITMVRAFKKYDAGGAGLDAFQSQMVKWGLEQGYVEPLPMRSDVKVMLDWCRDWDVTVHITSSVSSWWRGLSVEVRQLLLPGCQVDCLEATPMVANEEDGKGRVPRYEQMVKVLGVDPASVVLCSCDRAELTAAKEAGIGYVVQFVRHGDMVERGGGRGVEGEDFAVVNSFLQLCGSE